MKNQYLSTLLKFSLIVACMFNLQGQLLANNEDNTNDTAEQARHHAKKAKRAAKEAREAAEDAEDASARYNRRPYYRYRRPYYRGHYYRGYRRGPGFSITI